MSCARRAKGSVGKVALTDGPVHIRKRACKGRARGAGGRTIATMCHQFHKQREKGPKACRVALTDGPVHARKRACKGRARETGNVGQACCGQACRIRENAGTFLEWGESRRASGERASGVSMRCGKGTLAVVRRLSSPAALLQAPRGRVFFGPAMHGSVTGKLCFQ